MLRIYELYQSATSRANKNEILSLVNLSQIWHVHRANCQKEIYESSHLILYAGQKTCPRTQSVVTHFPIKQFDSVVRGHVCVHKTSRQVCFFPTPINSNGCSPRK